MEMEPRPTEKKMVEQIHENMLPQLKRIVQRQDCPTVDDLIDQAARAELTLEKERGDRTPVPASSAIVPDAAYGVASGNCKSSTKTRPAPQVAGALIEESKPQITPADELLAQVKEMVALLKSQQSAAARERRLSAEKKPKPFPGRRPSPKRQAEGKKQAPQPATSAKGGDLKGRCSPKARSPERRTGGWRPSCNGCGMPNMMKRFCPTCSGNGPARA